MHLETVNLLRRRPPARAVPVVHHKRVQSGVRKARGGTKPACAGPNHDDIKPLIAHQKPPRMPPVGPASLTCVSDGKIL
jgi:hypothetical protein